MRGICGAKENEEEGLDKIRGVAEVENKAVLLAEAHKGRASLVEARAVMRSTRWALVIREGLVAEGEDDD